MSWFGEQFNNIAEKLTDFSKEVHEINNQNEVSSNEKLVQLCKEKDEKIMSLTEEKTLFERNLEELDQQHQEAIEELLSLKSNLIKENKELKIKLSKREEEIEADVSKSFHSCLDLSFNGDVKFERNDSDPNVNSKPLDYYKSLIVILCSLKDCADDNKITKQISDLQNQTPFLDQKSSTLEDIHNPSTEKINYYLNCLQNISSNNQTMLPMIEDIASLIDLLVISNKFHSKRNLCEKKQKCLIHNDEASVEKYVSFNQTDSSFYEIEKHTLDSFTQIDHSSFTDAYSQTDSFNLKVDSSGVNSFSSPPNSLSVNIDSICQTEDFSALKPVSNTQCSQTEPLKCDSCLAFRSVKDSLTKLEAEISELRETNSTLVSENHKLCFKSVKCSTLVQTDVDLSCKCKELTDELEKTKLNLIDIQKQFHERENGLNLKFKNQEEILTAAKKELTSKEKLLLESTNQNSHQEKELLRLKSELSNLNTQISMLKNPKAENVDTYKGTKVCQEPNICSKCSNESYKNEKDFPSDIDNEKTSLKEKVKNLELERNRMLCVLTEKTQECSSLKSEVHKLTSIVASEKQALMKLQQDNCDLTQSSKSNLEPELSKETVKKLSCLIQDKDFEIESLKQKNSTLTALIAETSSVPEHLQSLIDERENLTKQINVFKGDREKIMKKYNAKDQECRQYMADLKKVNTLLTSKSEKFDILQQEHHSVAQQYEEKQKSLINTQNEMIALKQRVTDLEQQQCEIKVKYSELLNKINSDSMIQITREELSSKIQEIEQLTHNNQEKDGLIQEKDCMIHNFTQQIRTLKMEFEREDSLVSNLRKETTELKEHLKTTEFDLNQLQEDKDACEQKYNDKCSELLLLKEMNDRLNMGIKEKEYVIQSMTEKISSLSQFINNDHSNSSPDTDINRILADSEAMFSKMQDLSRERDETLLSLSQSQQECLAVKNEIQKLKNNENHLKNELERLREHLLQIEENYTIEALRAEEREKELRDQLLEVSRRAEISSTAIVDTNQRASIQITSLQEQLRIIANQRDEALSQVSELEDKVQKLSASVNNLQFVLEQIQRSSEKKLKDAEKKLVETLNNEKEHYKKLERELNEKKIQLKESSQALEAATRLSEQLDAKEEVISTLKAELSRIEKEARSSAQEINAIRSNTEGKVDRVVMKSLVLGYFSTPPGQKSEVIRLLARVLDFNQEEMEKAGIIVQRTTGKSEHPGILSSIFNRWPLASQPSIQHTSSPNKDVQKSFTTLFVQFLENESQPIIPMPFPAEKMAQELTLKSQTNKKLQSPENKQEKGNSPLLLNIDAAFPTFTPVPAVEYTKSPAPLILKEMLD